MTTTALKRWQIAVYETEHSGDEELAIEQLAKAGGRAIAVESRPYASDYGQEVVVLSFDHEIQDWPTLRAKLVAEEMCI
jgi:hypothetical protein